MRQLQLNSMQVQRERESVYSVECLVLVASVHLIMICRYKQWCVNSAIKPHSRIITLMESVSYVRYTVSLMPRVHFSVLSSIVRHFTKRFQIRNDFSIWTRNERNKMTKKRNVCVRLKKKKCKHPSKNTP